MSIDKESLNTGYLLGRMLAIVEKAQEISTPNIPTTIKSSLYSTFSVTPSALFTRVNTLYNNCLGGIQSEKVQQFLKRQLNEVTTLIDKQAIPVKLSFDDQAKFASGYQNQQFYLKLVESYK